MSTGKYTGTIKSLLHNAAAKGLCTEKEYSPIVDMLLAGKKLKMLVFGTGADCLLWLAANNHGHVWFIEDDPVWYDRWSVLPNILRVEYASSGLRKDKIHSSKTLHMNFAESIEKTDWDVILVDGPVASVHGRMKSIYNAHRLAGKNTTVFIHDYNRKTERLYADRFFDVQEVVERMAICKLT